MFAKHVVVAVSAFSLLVCHMGFCDDKDNTTEGTVEETGWGKFKIKDKDGTLRLFHVSKKSTTFSPEDWRPMKGDKVSVKFSTFQRRNATIAQIDSVKLVEAGPNTPRMTSPVEVEIREVGRSGFRVKLLDSGKLVKFSRHRGTQMEPVGWTPAVGDKAKITFSFRTGMMFGVTYIADKVEKIKAQK